MIVERKKEFLNNLCLLLKKGNVQLVIWDVLIITNVVSDDVKATPVTAFWKNILLKNIIGADANQNNQKHKITQNTHSECTPCNTSRYFYYQKIIATARFRTIQTKEKIVDLP